MEKNDPGQTSSTNDGLMREHQEQIERLLHLIEVLDKSLSSDNTYVDVKRTVVRIMTEANDKIQAAIIEQDVKRKVLSIASGPEKSINGSWSKKSENEQIQLNDHDEHVSGIEYCDSKTVSIKSSIASHKAGEQKSEGVSGQTSNNISTASLDRVFAGGVPGTAVSDVTEQDIRSTATRIVESIFSPSVGSLKMALVNYLQNNIRDYILSIINGSRATQSSETSEINLKDIALLKNSTKESKFGIVK